MGQQQLLLIVLGAIIVGIAVVAGIYLYLHRAEEAVKDEVYSQNLDIAKFAIEYFSTPENMGGGGRNYEKFGEYFSGLPRLNETTNAIYSVEIVSQNEIKIKGEPKTNLGYKWKVITQVKATKVTTAYEYE
jgi:hypothetical protein